MRIYAYPLKPILQLLNKIKLGINLSTTAKQIQTWDNRSFSQFNKKTCKYQPNTSYNKYIYKCSQIQYALYYNWVSKIIWMEVSKMNARMNKLGITLGIVFGLSMLVFALLSIFLGLGTEIVTLMASLYIGYAATYVGGLIGFLWGFVHGYIVGIVVVLVGDFLDRH